MSIRNVKTTFEASDVIQPFYTGGPVSSDQQAVILATCLGDNAVLSNFRDLRILARLEGDGEAITSLCLTPTASYLVVCSRSLSMRIYSLEISETALELTATLIRTTKPHSIPVVITAIDDTGTLLATGCADGTLKIWNIAGGYVSHTFKAHSGVISSLKFFQSSRTSTNKRQNANQHHETEFLVASGGEDGSIRIWDLSKRKPLAAIDAHSSVVTSIDYSQEADALVSGSRDKTLAVWNARTWKVSKVLPVLESIESVGIIAGGKLVYCGGENGRVRIWDIDQAKEITRKNPEENKGSAFKAIIRQPDEGTILCVREDLMLELRDLNTLPACRSGKHVDDLPVIRQISGTHDEVIDLEFVAPGKNLMALATNTESIKLVNVRQSRGREEEMSSFGSDVALLEGHEDIILCLAADPSGTWLATGAKDNTARLWQYDEENMTFDCTTIFTGHAGSVGAVALAQAVPDKTELRNGTGVRGVPRFIVTGSQDRTVKVWDVKIETGAVKPISQSRSTHTRKAHDKDINAVALDPDCRLFASASQDRLVKIWSAEECEVQGVLRGHKRGVWSVSFAPKGTPAISGEAGPESSKRGFILTGSGDSTVKIWSLSNYSCLKSFEGHVNSILKVVWIPPPDGGQTTASSKRSHLVASAGGDGLVKVWDTQSGECICTLDNHTERVWALAFDQQSQRLVSGGGDGVITFWSDTTETTMATAVAESTARVEQEQTLMNHIHRGNYRDAIVLALQLNHPARLLSLFSDVVKTSPSEQGSLCGVKAVDEVIAGLDEEQLFTLLLRLRDWNANARTAPVAQKVLWAVFKIFPASKLVQIKKNGRGLGEVLEGLRAYTDRHFRRTDELLEESYLVDFVVRSMGNSGFEDGVTQPLSNGVHQNGTGSIDVVMVE